MPSILMMPIVAIWGPGIDQRKISFVVGIISIFIFLKILEKTKFNLKTKIWLLIFFGLGNNFLLSILIGTSWYLAHSFAILFLLLAINEIFGKKRPFLIGLFFILASLSRTPVILSFPFFFFIIINKKFEIKKLFQFFTPIIMLGLLYLIYNYVRYQSIFDQAYYYLYQREFPDTSLGIFNVSYFWKNFFYTFINPPEFSSNFPFLKFNPYGTGLFLVSPFFFYLFFASYKKKINYLSLVAIILTAVPGLIFHNTGYLQFGPRFALDYLPFLMLLLFSGIRKEVGPLKISFIIISVIINISGLIFFYPYLK